MSSNARYWSRWAAVLPGSLAAAVLVSFPLHWAVMLLYGLGGDPEGLVTTVTESGEVRGCTLWGLTCFISAETMERHAMAFFMPYSVVFAGAWIAPSRRNMTAVVLAILVALALGGLYALAFAGDPKLGLRGWESLHYGATPVLNFLGLGVALAFVRAKG